MSVFWRKNVGVDFPHQPENWPSKFQNRKNFDFEKLEFLEIEKTKSEESESQNEVGPDIIHICEKCLYSSIFDMNFQELVLGAQKDF